MRDILLEPINPVILNADPDDHPGFRTNGPGREMLAVRFSVRLGIWHKEITP
jgi:hypothetical protein